MSESNQNGEKSSHVPLKRQDAHQQETLLPSLDVREPVPDFEEEIDLRDLLDVVIRRKWLIISILFVVFITTLVVSLAMTPIFKASGRLQVQPASVRVTKFEDIVESQLRTVEFIKTQVELLKSPTLALRVIKKLRLDENPLFNPFIKDNSENVNNPDENTPEAQNKPGILSFWRGLLKTLRGSGKKPAEFEGLKEEEVLKKIFLNNLEVATQRDTTVIRISFKHPDPFLASDIVNTLLTEFVDWQMDQKIQSAALARQQLEKQIEQARIKLEASETKLNEFAKRAGIVSLDSKLNLIYRQLEEINKALAEAQAERISKEAKYKQAQSGDIESLPEVLNSPLIQQLRQGLVEATSEYEKLIPVYKPEYPRLKILRAKIQEIQDKISAEEKRILRGINNDYLRALEREKQLTEAAKKKKQEALKLNEKATQYKILEREVETNKQIYQSLLERAREIEANVGAEISNIHIVDRAKPPIKPFRPNIRLNLLVAIVLGIFLGIGGAFLLEYFDNTIKRIEEITDRFKLPLLGVLPHVDADESEELEVIVQKQPKAGFAEAIRTALVSIELSAPLESPPKLLLITSTGAGEGKTTVSSNIALALALMDKRVLLIDCDLRRPCLHKIYGNGKKPAKGISNYLSGGSPFDAIIQKTGFKNLYFVPAGPIPPNPAELLASMRMKKTLSKLKDIFDYVVIDAPPAAGFADVLVLGNMVDGVILVSSLGETHREALRIFRRSMLNVKAHLLGCIINKLPISHKYGSYGYYKYYKYSYYYQPYAYYGKKLVDQEALAESDREETDFNNIKNA